MALQGAIFFELQAHSRHSSRVFGTFRPSENLDSGSPMLPVLSPQAVGFGGCPDRFALGFGSSEVFLMGRVVIFTELVDLQAIEECVMLSTCPLSS